jgi:hypothetical protein
VGDPAGKKQRRGGRGKIRGTGSEVAEEITAMVQRHDNDDQAAYEID